MSDKKVIQRVQFELVCYLELWEVDSIIKNIDYVEYAYIQHKPEKDNNKLHVHVYLKTKSKHDINHIANLFNISVNLVSKVLNRDALLRYFTHLGYDKIQYPITDIISNIKSISNIIMFGLVEPVSVDMLFDYLKTIKEKGIHYNTFNDFIFDLYSNHFGKFILKNTYFLHSFYRSLKLYETGYKCDD